MSFVAGYNIGPKIAGIDFTKKHTTAQHAVGTVAYDHKGRKWVYVNAGGTIGAFRLAKAASADDPYTSVVIATASNAATKVLGMATIALASGDFAWIVTNGIVEDDAIVVSAAVAAGDPIISDAGGGCTIAVETDINNIIGHVLVDDTDNTGTIYLQCN